MKQGSLKYLLNENHMLTWWEQSIIVWKVFQFLLITCFIIIILEVDEIS